MDSNALELIKRGDERFSKRAQLDSFRHEVALNFAPWLAEWTSPLQWGEDFASHLVDGTPLLLARDYVNQIGAMLRPPGKQWFWRRTASEDLNNDPAARNYLDWRSRQTMRMIFDRKTGAQRSLKHADVFYGLFGDAVVSIDTDDVLETLRINSFHTKDCVWAMGPENKPDVLTRKEWVSARNLMKKFRQSGDKLHEKVREAYDKQPDRTFEIRHEVLPADEYEPYKRFKALRPAQRASFASVWIDVENKCVIRERTTPTFRYVIPASLRMPNGPYGLSMATVIALPDARLIQQQALAILEAAEKNIDPPLIAMDGDTIRGDIDLSRNGITWIDRAYDDRNGAPLVPLELGKNFQLGIDSLVRTEMQITRAFHLDVLRMPDTRGTKSVEEIQFRIDEYVRSALPLFAPMQAEYNEAMLFEVDAVAEALGVFPRDEMPDMLKREGDDVNYAWDNPLTDMMERQKSQEVAEIAQHAQAVLALEQAAMESKALRRFNTERMAIEPAVGLGGARYLLSDEEMEDKSEEMDQAKQQRQMIEAAPNMAQIIDSGVNAAQVASEIPNPATPGVPLLPMPQ